MSRFLFVMPETGHLRMYETTLRALAGKGHDVCVAYDSVQKSARDRAAFEEAPQNLRMLGAVPPVSGPWRDALVELGCTIDYVRFLSRRDGTPYLRSRMDKYLPSRAAWLRRAGPWPAAAVSGLARAATWTERAVPADEGLTGFLRAVAPDAVVVTPLVMRGPGGVQQTALVKAARVLGIPVALAVGSWDHLSSKGFIRVDPDLVIVWNAVQAREAVEMHGVAPSRICVTGAQPFDHWFGRQPTVDREAFLARVELPADRRMILYAGSSRGIANPALEIPFVTRWLEAIRHASDSTVRSAAVLVRPHLSNVAAWANVDLSALGPVSIWPRERPSLPMNELETSDYFHSLYHSTAVVGLNTSAMIEASILDRPVLTVQVPDFRHSQSGTRHFRYLLPEGGGSVESTETLEEHVTQLSRAVENPAENRPSRQRFVASFVRPRGLDRLSLDAVVDVIERLPGLRTHPQTNGARWLAPLRWGLRAVTSLR